MTSKDRLERWEDILVNKHSEVKRKNPGKNFTMYNANDSRPEYTS